MSQPPVFYLIETITVVNWLLVGIGLLVLSVYDWLERYDGDRMYYRRHWRLIAFTYIALFTAFVLEKTLRMTERGAWKWK